VIFGAGCLRDFKPSELGRKALVVGGRNSDRAAPLLEILKRDGVSSGIFNIAGEPTVDAVTQGVAQARQSTSDFVISIGGGSVIDCGKAIAALLTNGGNALDYLEVIGKAKPLINPPVPFIAIPTTAGTGAEVTRNAVLASLEHRVKVSLRSSLMLPRLALVDPELTSDLPRSLTASTGMDALTQLIEPYVCIRANPITDSLCVDGIGRVARSLRRAWDVSSDMEARTDMSIASLFSGMALANAGLGAVHGFAAAIGGMFSAPHGAICAALLPHVMEANIAALQRRQSAPESLGRYRQIARLLTGNPNAASKDCVAWVRQLCRDFGIPGLGSYGIAPKDVPLICEKASVASSMKANPVVLDPATLQEVLTRAL